MIRNTGERVHIIHRQLFPGDARPSDDVIEDDFTSTPDSPYIGL
jgi:hypothetical protein